MPRPGLRSMAVSVGRSMADKVFSGRRSNNTEAHLSRVELAAMLAAAYELGVEDGERVKAAKAVVDG